KPQTKTCYWSENRARPSHLFAETIPRFVALCRQVPEQQAQFWTWAVIGIVAIPCKPEAVLEHLRKNRGSATDVQFAINPRAMMAAAGQPCAHINVSYIFHVARVSGLRHFRVSTSWPASMCS